jgi:phosphoglucosamine mutase
VAATYLILDAIKTLPGFPRSVGRWFGSSGVRGPYPADVNADLALRLGLATGATCRRLLVGHDPRLTSPLLTQAFVAGALSAGAAVDLAGPAATPSIAYGAREYEAGVAVTASHNPAPDNGFKFWNPDGSAWLPDQEDRLEAALERESPRAAWDRLATPRPRTDVTARHAEAILRFVGPLTGRVVLDCGHGAGGYLSPGLFREAGLEVDLLHGEPDGRFPGRPSEPTPENLVRLRERCRATRSWGIAHDGDADRMVPVDPQGEVVPPERVLVALALHLGAKRIATPVDASLALARALAGVEWVYTRVGDAHVSAAVRTQSGDFGAETSGTYVVPKFSYAPDGPLAALLFLRAQREGLADEATRRLGPVYRRTEKVALGAVHRDALRAALARLGVAGHERATRVDGLRVDGPGGWVLVRPSGTEPIARITAEGGTPQAAEILLSRGRGLLQSALAAAATRPTPP